MIQWKDMIDSIYAITTLTDLNLEKNKIYGISIINKHITVWFYDNENVLRHKTLAYQF